eukprot:CAMPEP_0174368626 /NCGR_PEP_ID=MMETSP0811_2-20130205/89801_1 /TAXON_ID=73025 ORGANISM="Eutreptiella gymnastica-like, Strain CCMP1594" /NCGR_SAMPLE_ID=MMETSP0811_2 /ASSEMBLY_ACC=CAM_ASM_000667 /LENGTH=128 /DNA_ID=CAMNT_0015512331 /DNA_START=65 /DNA_END=448 /DNA_ORIENTATION=+
MAEQSISPDGGALDKRAEPSSTLMPVVVKQLVEAQCNPDDNQFFVNGSRLTELTFIGKIAQRDASQAPGRMSYTLDDGTGLINAVIWIDPDSPTATQLQALESMLASGECETAYLRVYGNLRTLSGQR